MQAHINTIVGGITRIERNDMYVILSVDSHGGTQMKDGGHLRCSDHVQK